MSLGFRRITNPIHIKILLFSEISEPHLHEREHLLSLIENQSNVRVVIEEKEELVGQSTLDVV